MEVRVISENNEENSLKCKETKEPTVIPKKANLHAEGNTPKSAENANSDIAAVHKPKGTKYYPSDIHDSKEETQLTA